MFKHEKFSLYPQSLVLSLGTIETTLALSSYSPHNIFRHKGLL